MINDILVVIALVLIALRGERNARLFPSPARARRYVDFGDDAPKRDNGRDGVGSSDVTGQQPSP